LVHLKAILGAFTASDEKLDVLEAYIFNVVLDVAGKHLLHYHICNAALQLSNIAMALYAAKIPAAPGNN